MALWKSTDVNVVAARHILNKPLENTTYS